MRMTRNTNVAVAREARPRTRSRLAGLLVVLIFLAPAEQAVAAGVTAGTVSGPDAIPIRVIDLANRSKELDGKTVSFTAEAIGDVMRRGDDAWVNFLDSTGPVGVFMSKDLAAEIASTGGYSRKGDLVEIVGVFNRACNMHGGDSDVHAQSLTVVARGYPVSSPVSEGRIMVAVGLALLAGTLAYVYFRHNRAPGAGEEAGGR
jgi:hypothetical protein